MNTHALIDRDLHPGNHVRVPGHQDHVRTVTLERCLDHVRDQQSVDGLLRAAIPPLDQLTGPELHSLDNPQRPLVAVRTRIRDAVIPVLTLDRLINQTMGNLI